MTSIENKMEEGNSESQLMIQEEGLPTQTDSQTPQDDDKFNITDQAELLMNHSVDRSSYKCLGICTYPANCNCCYDHLHESRYIIIVLKNI